MEFNRRPQSKRATAVFAALSLSLSLNTAAYAQAGAAGQGGPIDIQANEQEFAGDHVIARGNVRVTYKDCVVVAPIATLYRDSAGSPQKAIFTGHPRLVQGQNKIDADTLVFEVGSGKVVGDGNVHSEVISMEPEPQTETPVAEGKAGEGKGKTAAAGKTAKKPAPAESTQIAEGGDVQGGGESDVATTSGADDTATATAKPATAAAKGKKTAPPKVTEKIITDADHQEYERNTGRFAASGHVRVKHGDISVRSDRLNLVYGNDSKPETAVFTGNVLATQFDNCTQADLMTYFISTQRLQATGNVRSKVIQKADNLKKGGLLKGPGEKDVAESDDPEGKPDEPIFITSDAQDYSRDSGRMTAEGNVRVYYGEATGSGPKMILLRDEQGQCEKVIFTGRSQISQPGKRWIGDKITFTMNDKKVLAEGNTKAIILQTNKQPKPTLIAPPPEGNSKLAGKTPPAVSEKPVPESASSGTKM